MAERRQISPKATVGIACGTAAALWLVVSVAAALIADGRGVLAGLVLYGLLTFAGVLVVMLISALAGAFLRRRGARGTRHAVLAGLLGPLVCAFLPIHLAATAPPFVY